MKSRGLSRRGRLCAAAQDGDEPEPQDRRDRPEPGHRGRAARPGRRRMSKRLYQITAGFMPLLDSALLVAAQGRRALRQRRGSTSCWCARPRGRTSATGWRSVISTSRTCLAPMPIACNLGLTPLAARTIVPMALGLGGNAVTVSNALWADDGGGRRQAGSRPERRRRGTCGGSRSAHEGRTRAASLRGRAPAFRS